MLIFYKSKCISDVQGNSYVVLCFDTINKCYINNIHEDCFNIFMNSDLQCIVSESPVEDNLSFHFAVQYLRYIDRDTYDDICSSLYYTSTDNESSDKIMFEKIFDSCGEDVNLFIELRNKYIQTYRNGYYYTY